VNAVAAVDASSSAGIGLVFRFQDPDNFVAALYAAEEREIYLLNRSAGENGMKFARTKLPDLGPNLRISAEVRDWMAIVSITDGQTTVTSPIVDIYKTALFAPQSGKPRAGGVGILRSDSGKQQTLDNFEVRASPSIPADGHLERRLYDAAGRFRGELRGDGIDMYETGMVLPGWGDFAKNKHILLDAYRPERIPYGQDWVLVLDAMR
jgi:hypothetical protein